MNPQRFGYLSSRPASAADEEFLAALYASTRTNLQHLPVPREVIDAIVRHQHALQALGYAEAFPDAEYLVLEHDGIPIGRAVLSATPRELRLVDLSIVPEARRLGHARAVLAALQERATARGCAVALRVRNDNDEARALYGSLGFMVVSSDEVAQQMRWTPASD
ncbi:MAG TPA: GNAT family N-acetyltransferase [Telluria sp.]|nr:GNAT family N-acetyltransferase [Telluria sp.]